MVIRLSSLKGFLWFWVAMLLALAFPLQVYTDGPYPSLLPYALIGCILLVSALFPSRRSHATVARPPRRSRRITSVVGLYVCLLLLNTGWQVGLGYIGLFEALSAFSIYLLPVVFYAYFRQRASEREVRSLLRGMAFTSVIVGLYFVYESYLKLALGQVAEYAVAAYQYSVNRSSLGEAGISSSRIATNFRSYGLLESHSISGAWIVMGSLAVLALVPAERRMARRLTLIVFGAMLLLTLNFTAIVAFSIIMFVTEFGGLTLLRGRLSKRLGRNLVSAVLTVGVMAAVAFWVAGDVMSEYIVANLVLQKDFALGTGDSSLSMLGITWNNLDGYFQHVLALPLTALLGDGFSSFGGAKGGDTGFVETMGRFGLPLFLLTLFGLVGLIRGGLREMRALPGAEQASGSDLNRALMLQFAVSMALLVLITEGHYTVWSAKSILPFVFFALALFDRYLPARRHARLRTRTEVAHTRGAAEPCAAS